ncbi:hypothetical protein ACFVGV_17590 [Pseudarthrobacter scleromae]|uniref:hypothetical protein n=1 Tax=Pseudarthrobacter scleromae TaxID=158897 RepID=UPI00362A25CE
MVHWKAAGFEAGSVANTEARTPSEGGHTWWTAPENAENLPAAMRTLWIVLGSSFAEKTLGPLPAASISHVDADNLRDALREALVAIEGQPATSVAAIAHNMAAGIAALGPALAEIETPVSPQLARSLAATENAWRKLEAEFGLLSSREVSELVGSRSPNRSYASEQRSKGKLLAVKRPGGLRYPGYQFDRTEHAIRPVMADLIRVASEAERSEASVALWMTLPSGYLDGARPVDQLSDPDKVVEAAQQSFNVQW